jgi:hypothetical protein
MPETPAIPVGDFGSAHRAGRDDPAFQADRLMRLCAFSLRLLDAYRRRLAYQERAGREIWTGKQWLEAESTKWQRAAAETEKVAREQARWIRQLEEARVYLSDSRQEHEELIAEQQKAIAGQQKVIAEQENAIAGQQKVIAEQQKVLAEQADWFKQLQEANAYLNQSRQTHEAMIADQQKLIAEQADYIKQLLEAKAWLLGQLETHQAQLDRLRGSGRRHLAASVTSPC